MPLNSIGQNLFDDDDRDDQNNNNNNTSEFCTK